MTRLQLGLGRALALSHPVWYPVKLSGAAAAQGRGCEGGGCEGGGAACSDPSTARAGAACKAVPGLLAAPRCTA